MKRNAKSTGAQRAQPSTCHLTWNLLSRRLREECQTPGSVTCSLWKPWHTVSRVITCDQKVGEPWSIELYSDSDWAGCLETRRSTDSHLAIVAGAVVTCTTQTQPGLPATSCLMPSFEEYLERQEKGSSWRISSLDFGQACGKPRLWTDSSAAIQASKRIGPGAKLRHLEVCEFYVQGALQAKLLSLGKVKGTVNCAKFLTKHPKSGTEARQALPGLGMYEPPKGEDIPPTSKQINVKVSQINKQSTWRKTPIPASVAWTHKQAEGAGKTATVTQGNAKVNAMKTLVLLSQINAVAAQQQEINTWQLLILYVLAAIGNYHRVVENVSTWQMDRGLALSSWARGTCSDPRDGSSAADPRIANSADYGAHRNPQWKATGDHHWKCSKCRASRSPAAGRSGTDSSSCQRWHEERWVQRGAEANMTLEEFIRWRRQEERLIHGEDPDSGEDSASAEEESSGGAGCPAGAGRPARAVWPAGAGRPAAARARVPTRHWGRGSKRSLPEHDGRGARCVAKSRRPVLRDVDLLGSHRVTCHSKEGCNIPWVKTSCVTCSYRDDMSCKTRACPQPLLSTRRASRKRCDAWVLH